MNLSMKKVMCCTPVILALIMYSCEPGKSGQQISQADLLENLELSNETILVQSKFLYQTLVVEQTQGKANTATAYVLPQADILHAITERIYASIMDLGEQLPSTDTEGKGSELFALLPQFIQSVSVIGSEYTNDNLRALAMISKPDVLHQQFNAIVQDANKRALQTFLTRIKNAVAILENNMLTALNISSKGLVRVRMDNLAGFVSQSSKRLHSGDTLEISAGVAAVSTTSKPSVQINGSHVEPGADGMARYRFPVDGKPGVNVVTVSIMFTSIDGSQTTSQMPITYYIEN